MFRNTIDRTPLTNDYADSYFENITGDSFSCDRSFVATLRALLATRMKEGDRISVRFARTQFASVVDASDEDIVNAIRYNSPDLADPDTITVHNVVSRDKETTARVFGVTGKQMADVIGYTRLEKITKFYEKGFAVDCFINQDIRSVILLVENLDIRKLHYLQASTMAWLPWYFKKGEKLLPVESDLCYGLTDRAPDKYLAAIAKIAEQFNFREGFIRSKLKGFELASERLELEQTRNNIRAHQAKIDELNEKIGHYLATINDEEIRILGLERKIELGVSNDSEIMNFFLSNKALLLEDCNCEGELTFVTRGYMESFRPDVAETMIRNQRSVAYRNCPIPVGDMRRLLEEVVLSETPRVKLRFCAAYKFRTHGEVSPIGGYNYPEDCSGYMPNPHIDQYRCMGNYISLINQALRDRNYLYALSQCIASGNTLSWTDGTVVEAFFRTLYDRRGDKKRCFELPDGSVVDPAAAAAWLKAQDGVTAEASGDPA